jgi:DNA-binding MarR family transcriptional regulator
VQATSSPTQARGAEQLVGELYAFISFLHQLSTPDVLAAFGELELTLSQLKLLHALASRSEPVSVKEAAALLPLSLPAASRTIDDLVRRGFAERHEDPLDRRMKRVSVTDAGRRTIRRLDAARIDRLREFAAMLSEDERTRLRDALALLLERAEIAGCRLEQEDL